MNKKYDLVQSFATGGASDLSPKSWKITIRIKEISNFWPYVTKGDIYLWLKARGILSLIIECSRIF